MPVFTDGDLVLVESGLIHVGARIEAPATEPNVLKQRVWLDVNVMGTHLPQQYGLDELREIDDEIAKHHGLCSTCLGLGVSKLLPAAACVSCGGSGRPALSVSIVEDANGATATVDMHDDRIAEIGCAQCRAAFTSA